MTPDVLPLSTPPAIGWAVFLAPSWAGLFVGSALVAFTAARLCARAPSLLQRILGFGVWSAALLVGYAEILSSVGQLHWPAALALSALGALAVRLWLPGSGPRPLGRQIASVRAAIGAPEAARLLAFAVPVLAWGLFSAWLILVSAEPLGDNVTYHLPRLAYWMQHQTLAWFPSNDPRISTFPVSGNLLQLWPALFLRRERLCAFVQLASHLGTALAVYALARNLGAPRLGSAAAALCWLTIPAALVQAATSNVDLIASFFAAAACALALTCLRGGTGWTAWTCIASAALAVGTKPQTLPLAVACSVAALVALRRTGRAPLLRLLPLLLLATLLGGMHPLRNARALGSPSGLTSVGWLMLNPGLPTLAKNAQLVLLPLTGGVGLARQFPRWTLTQTLFERGLGVVWPVVISGALLAALARRIRARGLRPVPTAYALLALAYGIAVLFTMRHQPSVDRFFLPAAAVLTPVASVLFVGRIRAVALAVVWALGCGALFHCVQTELARRAPPHAGRFLRYSDVAGSDWDSLVRASERLAREGRGRRVGIVTGQSVMQRLLLGSRFQNVLVPLSHDPPLALATLERLRLDAVYIAADRAFNLQLFRGPWAPPPAAPDRGLLTARDGFDEDFLRAYRLAVEFRRFDRTALLLGGAGSGWDLDPSVRCNALYFVRRPTSRAALGIVQATSPYGIQERDDHRVFWLGSERTLLKVFSAGDGAALLRVRLEQGTELAPGALLEARLADQEPTSVPMSGSETSVALPMRAGITSMSVRIVGPSSPGAVRLELAWDDRHESPP